jgi:hypothetical protein
MQNRAVVLLTGSRTTVDASRNIYWKFHEPTGLTRASLAGKISGSGRERAESSFLEYFERFTRARYYLLKRLA